MAVSGITASSLFLLLLCPALAAQEGGGGPADPPWRDRLRHSWGLAGSYLKVEGGSSELQPFDRHQALRLEGGWVTPYGQFVLGGGRREGEDKLYRFPNLLESPIGWDAYDRRGYSAWSGKAGYGLDTDRAPAGAPLPGLRRRLQLRFGGGFSFLDQEDHRADRVGTTRIEGRAWSVQGLARVKEGAWRDTRFRASWLDYDYDIRMNYRLTTPSTYRYTHLVERCGSRLETGAWLPLGECFDLGLGYEQDRLEGFRHRFRDPTGADPVYQAAFPYPDFGHDARRHLLLAGGDLALSWGILSLRAGVPWGTMSGYAAPIEVDRGFGLEAEARLFGAGPEGDQVLGFTLRHQAGRSDRFTLPAFGSAYGGAPLGGGFESAHRLRLEARWSCRDWDLVLSHERRREAANILQAPVPVFQVGTNRWDEDLYGLALRCRRLAGVELGLSFTWGEGRAYQHLSANTGGVVDRDFDLLELRFSVKYAF